MAPKMPAGSRAILSVQASETSLFVPNWEHEAFDGSTISLWRHVYQETHFVS